METNQLHEENDVFIIYISDHYHILSRSEQVTVLRLLTGLKHLNHIKPKVTILNKGSQNYFLSCLFKKGVTTHTDTDTDRHTHTHTHTRARARIHTHTHTHTHTNTHERKHARTHAPAHIYTHTHARTHARTHSFSLSLSLSHTHMPTSKHAHARPHTQANVNPHHPNNQATNQLRPPPPPTPLSLFRNTANFRCLAEDR